MTAPCSCGTAYFCYLLGATAIVIRHNVGSHLDVLCKQTNRSVNPCSTMFQTSWPSVATPSILSATVADLTASQPLLYFPFKIKLLGGLHIVKPPPRYLMQSIQSFRSFGSRPAVRSACEPCHERKIRCIISSDDGKCDSCQSRKLSCFFLPRARSGRRAMVNGASDRDTSSPSTNQASSGSRLPQTRSPSSEIQNDRFDWNCTIPNKALHHQSQQTEFLDLDLDLEQPLLDASVSNNFDLQGPLSERYLSEFAKADYQKLRLTDLSEFLDSDMPNAMKSTPHNLSSDHQRKDRPRLGEKEFSTFLQLCLKLQSHVTLVEAISSSSITMDSMKTLVPAPTIPVPRLQEMLGDINRSCDVAFEVYGQGFVSNTATEVVENMDHASVSLVTALTFKIFQICNGILSYNLLQDAGSNRLLLQKRLDFNVMQAKVVMSKIEELTQSGFLVSRSLALNASHVEHNIKSAGYL